MNISKKMQKLDANIEWFYGDDFKLDIAAKHYQEALALAQEVEHDLVELKNQIEVIGKDFSKESSSLQK